MVSLSPKRKESDPAADILPGTPSALTRLGMADAAPPADGLRNDAAHAATAAKLADPAIFIRLVARLGGATAEFRFARDCAIKRTVV